MRIIFIGTSGFAVPSLQKLIDENKNVVAAITATDKPKGRGQKVAMSPIKLLALQCNIPVLQPDNLKNSDFLKKLKSYNADLQIVVAFRMLPEAVWNMPTYGTFNLHASLLPQYRGAAPINWAIINGETETGVTTFFLQHKIDTGDILLQEKEQILHTDTASSLHDRLMKKGAKLVFDSVKMVESGGYKLQKQQTEKIKLKKAPKIYKQDCKIDWSTTSEDIYNFVRGLSAFPTAWTKINDKIFKIYAVEIINDFNESASTGEYKTDKKSFLHVRTEDGWVSIKELQQESKNKISINAFLRGNNLQ